VVELATGVERFRTGDYPPVCVRSGLPADRWVPVEATPRAGRRPWILLPLGALAWLVTWWGPDPERLWGLLPFAAGHVDGVSATWDRNRHVVVLSGAHPRFAEACEEHHRAAPPDRAAPPPGA
jgi:hypothetical protein